ncbi:MAG: SBBP repeat-containing protein [Bacteroidetes bacterium]|nr:SBBP repeat-containing protein [Bacteroidota bacterium]
MIWAKSAGGVYDDDGYNITVDKTGNSYVTGTFSYPWIKFDNIQLDGKVGPFSDMFVAKYDSAGNALWARGAGNDRVTVGTGVAVDSSGNVYISGGSGDLTYFKFDAATTISDDNSFIAKYSPVGTLLWAHNTAYKSYDFASDIALDVYQNIYVAGYINTTGIFGTDTLPTLGGQDIYVAKYDNNGNHIWVKNAGGTGTDAAYAVTLDNSNNILVAGYTSSQPAVFDASQVSATSSWDPCLAKLSNPVAVRDVHLSANDIEIYPNPANDMLYVVSVSVALSNVQINDITGRTLISESTTSKRPRLNLRSFPSGLYYLQLSDGTQTIIKKIIIQH